MNEPINNTNAKNNLNGDMSSLIGKLQSIDHDNALKTKRFSIIFGILIVFYGALMILNPSVTLIVIVAGFVVFLGVFLYSYHKTSRRDYSQPIKQLLISTRKSYRMISPEYLIANIAALSIILVSLHTLFNRYLNLNIDGLNPIISQLIITVLFYSAMLLLAYYIWQRKYGKIIKEIDNCLKDLEE